MIKRQEHVKPNTIFLISDLEKTVYKEFGNIITDHWSPNQKYTVKTQYYTYLTDTNTSNLINGSSGQKQNLESDSFAFTTKDSLVEFEASFWFTVNNFRYSVISNKVWNLYSWTARHIWMKELIFFGKENIVIVTKELIHSNCNHYWKKPSVGLW